MVLKGTLEQKNNKFLIASLFHLSHFDPNSLSRLFLTTVLFESPLEASLDAIDFVMAKTAGFFKISFIL